MFLDYNMPFLEDIRAVVFVRSTPYVTLPASFTSCTNTFVTSVGLLEGRWLTEKSTFEKLKLRPGQVIEVMLSLEEAEDSGCSSNLKTTLLSFVDKTNAIEVVEMLEQELENQEPADSDYAVIRLFQSRIRCEGLWAFVLRPDYDYTTTPHYDFYHTDDTLMTQYNTDHGAYGAESDDPSMVDDTVTPADFGFHRQMRENPLTSATRRDVVRATWMIDYPGPYWTGLHLCPEPEYP
jgi:hypothetical protein